MRLVSRLKLGFQSESTEKFSRRQVLSLTFKYLVFINVLFSQTGFAKSSGQGCGADALSALPDRPVAISRVERTESGNVRVAWPLRTSFEDGEDTFAPNTLQTGAEFDVLRCLPPGRWAALGQGEVVARNGAVVEGSLSMAGTPKSVDRGVSEELVSTGNLYPMPMVGDMVVVRRKEIQQAKKISPRVTIPVSQLFAGGDKDGGQVELTSGGQESLRQLLSGKFSDARGKLLIEVHAQRTGSRLQLRAETAMRAESIERFLRYEFGIAKDQLVSVGHGSDGFVPGFVQHGQESDFVVLRMFPHSAR
jgi:hypothetical protein